MNRMKGDNMEGEKAKLPISALFATNIAIGFVVAITILAIIFPAFKAFLGAILWHHWVAKGILMTIVFVVVLLLSFYLGFFKEPTENSLAKHIIFTIGVILAGVFAMFFPWLIIYQ
ncbi:hypothetical protein HKBW3S42_01243 [Candidatus Hakubella thermalkaliphila]|uniref:Uncharacterized protein n=1 Tax=Candidatus Hakubella thermalkaliphila TaxID=2754717 RepID=A0A6V8PMF9_9ACTN|nr:hypothetical protein HKBW3S42_01243 [Candidatus Hakubella thermalkaliphila]